VSKYVPDSHSDRIDRQERKSRADEASNLKEHLKEKFGTTTVTMYESPQQENEVEVEVPQCPECGEGVVVRERPRNHPPVIGDCKGCEKIYDFRAGDSR
jgi:ribosomal protein S27AE